MARRRKRRGWLLLLIPLAFAFGGSKPSQGCPPGTKRKTRTGPCEPDDEPGDEPGVEPGIIEIPTDGPDPGVTPGVIEVPGEPGDDPGIADLPSIITDFPRPERYYQVRGGDSFTGEDQGIATRYVRSALFLAAVQFGGLSVADANAWASSRDTNDLRLEATELIECAPTNDALYGTFAFSDLCHPSPGTGRCIRLLPQHANNLELIAANEQPVRNIRLGEPGDPPSVSQNGVIDGLDDFETLWLPGVDLQALWESDGTILRAGGTWSDGSSKIVPPPEIFKLHYQDRSNTARTTWGCAPFAVDFGET